MRAWLLSLARGTLLLFGRPLARLLFDLRIEGRVHLPTTPQPILLIANHFSWFDPPVLALALPFAPAFLVATEAEQRGWVRLLTRLFRCIPIWRGQVDREALRSVVRALQEGQIIAIFPEGGVNPELAELVARGEQIPEVQGNMSRTSAQLIRARSGVAWIALMSQARILPVALLGTEKIAANLAKFRRTTVTIRLGPLFGPLTVEADLKGAARRRHLDELTDRMMRQIAALCPHEQRGHYVSAQPGKPENPDDLSES